MDQQERYIRKKYIGQDGMLGIHVPATSTPEQIQKARTLIEQIHRLEDEALNHGLIEEPKNPLDDPRERLDIWARNMTKGETDQLAELMSEEIVELIKALTGRKRWLKKKLGEAEKDEEPS